MIELENTIEKAEMAIKRAENLAGQYQQLEKKLDESYLRERDLQREIGIRKKREQKLGQALVTIIICWLLSVITMILFF